MNNIKRYLDSGLMPISEKKQHLFSFKVSIPFLNYVNKTSETSLQKEYAQRDSKSAVAEAKNEMASAVSRIPQGTKIKAAYIKSSSTDAIFNITVSTANTLFYMGLETSKL